MRSQQNITNSTTLLSGSLVTAVAGSTMGFFQIKVWQNIYIWNNNYPQIQEYGPHILEMYYLVHYSKRPVSSSTDWCYSFCTVSTLELSLLTDTVLHFLHNVSTRTFTINWHPCYSFCTVSALELSLLTDTVLQFLHSVNTTTFNINWHPCYSFCTVSTLELSLLTDTPFTVSAQCQH